jgi:hypothetical protein
MQLNAFSQFRCTVRSDTSRIAAISAKREAAEELQVDDLGQARLFFAKLVQRFADPDKLSVAGPALGMPEADSCLLRNYSRILKSLPRQTPRRRPYLSL